MNLCCTFCIADSNRYMYVCMLRTILKSLAYLKTIRTVLKPSFEAIGVRFNMHCWGWPALRLCISNPGPQWIIVVHICVCMCVCMYTDQEMLRTLHAYVRACGQMKILSFHLACIGSCGSSWMLHTKNVGGIQLVNCAHALCCTYAQSSQLWPACQCTWCTHYCRPSQWSLHSFSWIIMCWLLSHISCMTLRNMYNHWHPQE